MKTLTPELFTDKLNQAAGKYTWIVGPLLTPARTEIYGRFFDKSHCMRDTIEVKMWMVRLDGVDPDWALAAAVKILTPASA